jgi:hypothetical protein
MVVARVIGVGLPIAFSRLAASRAAQNKSNPALRFGQTMDDTYLVPV